MAIRRATVERSARSLGDISQVAKQRALVTFGNLGVQFERAIVADGGHEVDQMLGIAPAVAHRPRPFTVSFIVNGVGAVAFQLQRPLLSVEVDEPATMPVATEAFPDD